MDETLNNKLDEAFTVAERCIDSGESLLNTMRTDPRTRELIEQPPWYREAASEQ